MSSELKLKYKELNWLGKGFENNSIISPFSLVKEEAFDASDQERLIELGVINKNNEINANFFPMLEILSNADGYMHTKFSRGPISAEKIIFSYEGKQISVNYDKDAIVINMPANPQGMIEYLKDYIGGSKLTGGDLSLELEAKEAFIFSIIVDLYRKDVFSAYAEEEVFVHKGLSKEKLLESVNNIRENSQNLSYYLFVLNSGFENFTMEEIEQMLVSLIDNGLIEQQDQYYFPVGEGLLFAGNFLIFENIIEIIIGQIHEGKLYRSNFLMLQAGPLDLVYLEKSNNNIILECMSSIKALEFMASVLNGKPNIV